MFEVLLETKHVRPPRPLVETAVSALAHIAIIAVIAGGSAVAGNQQAREKFEGFLQYLFPPDRAAKSGDEHIAFVGVGQVGTPKGEDRGEPVKVEKDVLTERAVVPQLATETAELNGIMQLAAQAQAVGAFSIVDVDSAAERDPMSAAPTYPKDLLTKNVEGYATLRFVVDSTGLIDLSTIKLVESTHPLFVKAVEDAMPRMRFRPAMMGHNPVRQLAEQLFKFEIKKPAPGGPTAKP
jgi:hypothetical protein